MTYRNKTKQLKIELKTNYTNCIKIDKKNGVIIGGSDPRKDGMAIGY